MNKLRIVLALAPLAAVGAPAMAHAQSFQTTVAIGPAYAPPPVQVETAPPSPGVGYVWVGGYWNWDGAQYQWNAGHWELPPYMGATYVAPQWGAMGNRWGFTPGGWRHRGAYYPQRPVYAQPAYAPQRPVFVQPGYGPQRPVFVQPGYARPGNVRPGYARPGYAQPGYGPQRPVYAQPGYQRPAVAVPAAQPGNVPNGPRSGYGGRGNGPRWGR